MPERIVIRVLHHPHGPWQAIEAVDFGVVSGRAGAAEDLVVVVGITRHGLACILFGCLPGGGVKVGLAESSVVDPGATHPSTDHGAPGRRDLQRATASRRG